jgi:phage/plasmid primase-like uncharacterized protein
LHAAHLTFLTRDYRHNEQDEHGKSLRRVYGFKKGNYIPFGKIDPDQPLLITEGVEDALSVEQLTGMQAIAAIDAGNLKVVNPPPCAELIICADNDGPGREAAEAAAARLATAGRKVRIANPDDWKDWNEALRDRNADPDALARAILNAPEYAPSQGRCRNLWTFNSHLDGTFSSHGYPRRGWS